MAIPDSQQYPWNLYLIDYVEDIVVFLGFKVFSSDIFYISVVEMRKSFVRETTIEKNQFSKI